MLVTTIVERDSTYFEYALTATHHRLFFYARQALSRESQRYRKKLFTECVAIVLCTTSRACLAPFPARRLLGQVFHGSGPSRRLQNGSPSKDAIVKRA